MRSAYLVCCSDRSMLLTLPQLGGRCWVLTSRGMTAVTQIRNFALSLLISAFLAGVAFWHLAYPDFAARQNDGSTNGPCACDLMGREAVNRFSSMFLFGKTAVDFQCLTKIDYPGVAGNVGGAASAYRGNIDWPQCRSPEIVARYKTNALISVSLGLVAFFTLAIGFSIRNRHAGGLK